ncbi:MAG: ATP-binding cassette domain-containing protein, partial [Bacilli bacterium]
MTMIQLEHVTKSYVSYNGEQSAVVDISFTVKQGQFVSLVGPSGCGKTSLLSIMAGLFPPTEGVVRIQGELITKSSPKIGYMLQQDYLLNWRTIKENIFLGLEIQNKRSSQTEAHALYLLAEMG